MFMKKYVSAVVDTPEILEQFLRRELGLSRKQISQAKFREEGICVNGERCRVTAAVKPGDQVNVLLESEDRESAHLVSGCGTLRILYEDEDILAVDKPSGMVVHPSHGHYEDSLANMAARYFREKGMAVRIRPVGRLDKDTSGIVLFAKNQVAAARLSEQKNSGEFCKEYLALVQGVPEQQKGTICTDMNKDPESLMKMKTVEKGLRAVTHYEIRQVFQDYSLIRVSIETGRTHQIRVHMASIGHPLLGDRLYGKDMRMERTALHAAACCFRQPFTGEKIQLQAELPEDMKKVMDGNICII